MYVVPSTIAAEGPLEIMWLDIVACWPEFRVEVPITMSPLLGPLTMELPAISTGVEV